MDVRFELFVADVNKSVAFYCDVLGFVEEQSSGTYHPVRRAAVVIGIGAQDDLGQEHYFQPEIRASRKGIGVEIVLEVGNIEAEYERIQASGYPIAEPLKQQRWGLSDFRLVDPDGYYLRITTKK